jgi:outer membrane receptor protein involved in Fe transport
MSLGSGDIVFALVAETNAQRFGQYVSTSYLDDGTPVVRRSNASNELAKGVYAEITVPIASSSRPLWGMEFAELQLAGRYDKYDLKASFLETDPPSGTVASRSKLHSVDPTAGIRFRPVKDVLVRTSYGTGYLPPYLNELQELAPRTRRPSTLRDPKRNNEALGSISFYSGGNSLLRPEESVSLSAGVVLTPRVIPDLRVSVDWTKIRKHDNILSLGLDQDTVNLEDKLGGLITRAAPIAQDPYGVGKIIAIDGRYRNLARAISESIDFALSYELVTTKSGNLLFDLNATRLIRNVRQFSPTSPQLEYAGTDLSPTMAANGSVTWTHNILALTLNARFLDSHLLNIDGEFDTQQNSDHVPSQTYVDLAAELSFGQASRRAQVLAGSKLRFGIKNVFDKAPRYNVTSALLYDPWDDPLRRSFFLSLRKSFGRQ